MVPSLFVIFQGRFELFQAQEPFTSKVYEVGTGEKAVLVLPDVFGWQSNAGRFFGIADTLADQGGSSKRV